jgi:L-lactate utilization protein LutB
MHSNYRKGEWIMDISKLRKNLESRAIACSYFENAAQAVEYLSSKIVGRTVGIGGSKTIEAIGLYERLLEANNVAWHWKAPGVQEVYDQAYDSEVYLSSANGISETGEIVNIDGRCNRLTGTMLHSKEVYYVVGTNKICPSLEDAMWRARNIASPLNARRFGLKTPCASGELKCHDCKSEQRICRGILITCMKPMGIDKMEVIIIDECLGY